MNEWDLLHRIKEAYQRILGGNLTGIYVHGSIAFGCFHWERSDIDFLVVVEKPLTQRNREQLIQVLLELDAFAPSKGFEMSVLLRSACSPFSDPTPYELHYSNAHRDHYLHNLSETCRALHGFDPDLAAHVTVINHVGLTLCGLPREQVFSSVSRASYLSSLWYDIEHAAEEAERDPVYFTLNVCRVAAYLETGQVLSKEQGGSWGLIHLPEDAEVIRSALASYRTGAAWPDGPVCCFFAEKMLMRIRQNADFLSCGIKKH